jgi:hypothetical protein
MKRRWENRYKARWKRIRNIVSPGKLDGFTRGEGMVNCAQKVMTDDRARSCHRLIAIFLALLAGPSLYGQSESATTGQRTASDGAAALAARDGNASNPESQNPYLGRSPDGHGELNGITAFAGRRRGSWSTAKPWGSLKCLLTVLNRFSHE